MNNLVKGTILTTLLCLGLSACGGQEEVKAPTKQPIKEQAVAKASEIDPEELLKSLRNHTSLVPIGDVPIPEDNPMKPEVLELGQILFFDPRLSGNNEISCQTCHDPGMGYGDNQPTFDKYTGGNGARNSPTVINAGYYTTNFWDGRAASLEEQALGPIQNPDEMNQPLDELINELSAVKGYQVLFQAAFDDGITEQNIAKALAAFQRQIVVKDTPYDRFLEGDTKALSKQEISGLQIVYRKSILCDLPQWTEPL